MNLVERLRYAASGPGFYNTRGETYADMKKAADEIERLHAEKEWSIRFLDYLLDQIDTNWKGAIKSKLTRSIIRQRESLQTLARDGCGYEHCEVCHPEEKTPGFVSKEESE